MFIYVDLEDSEIVGSTTEVPEIADKPGVFTVTAATTVGELELHFEPKVVAAIMTAYCRLANPNSKVIH